MTQLSDTARRLQRVAPDLRAAGVAGDYTQARVADVLRYNNVDDGGDGGGMKAVTRYGDTTASAAATTTTAASHDGSRRCRAAASTTATTTSYGESSSSSSSSNNSRTRRSSHEHGMDACLRPGVYADTMCSILDEQREQRYMSALRKPLGRAPAPPYTLPPTPPHGFGARPCRRHHYNGGDDDDDMLCTCHTIDKEDAADDGHNNSHSNNSAAAQTRTQGGQHNNSAHVRAAMSVWRDVAPKHTPGAQLNRQYDWQSKGIDPTQYCFGVRSDRHASDTPRQTSNHCSCFCDDAAAAASAATASTQLLPSRLTDYRRTVTAAVGEPRRYGFDNPATWGSDKRGRRGQRCAHAATQPPPQQQQQQEQQQDADECGSGCTETVRALLSSWAQPVGTRTATQTQTRTGTCADAEQQQQRDATTTTTTAPAATAVVLGDEATARQLLQPCHYVRLGVQSRCFAGHRSRDSVRALCRAAGLPLSDAHIDAIYDAAAAESGDGACGMEQFKNAAMRLGYL